MKLKNKDSRLFRRILQQAKPYRYKIVGYFFISLLATPLALLAPIPLKIVVDNVIGRQALPSWLEVLTPDSLENSTGSLLLLAIGLFLVISLLSSLQSIYSGSILMTKITQNILLDFRSVLLRHSQNLSIGYHEGKGAAHASYLIQYDANAVQNVIFSTLIPTITAVVTFCSMFYIMLSLDLSLALVALAVSPFVFFLTNRFRKPLRNRWRAYKKLDYSSISVINEVLNMIRVIKVFGRENYEGSRFQSRSEEAIKTRLRVEWIQAGLTLLIALATATGTVLVLYMGTLHVLDGILSLGNLLVIMSYLSQLYEPLKTIGSKMAGLQSHLASAERAFSILDQPVEVPESAKALPITKAEGHVVFENVSFSYNSREQVLHNISFEVQKGMRVGIAGRTGAGKSTLINLLFRFYDPSSGSILLDGQDIRDYKLEELRKQFSVVLQDTILFSGTIRDNIAYGALGCSDEEIIRAAKVANAHEFISRFPKGYHTKVGDKGMQLSGGERQRIALARAFIANAPIMVFDEPTSSIDTKTEAAIVESMERVMHGRTTFIIAHRLSTLENCDLLLIIDQGRIIKSTTNVTQTIREAIINGGLMVNANGEFIDQ